MKRFQPLLGSYGRSDHVAKHPYALFVESFQPLLGINGRSDAREMAAYCVGPQVSTPLRNQRPFRRELIAL